MPLNKVSPLNLSQAAAINKAFNHSITYVTPNPWQRIRSGEDARGDCKTYATSKYDALIALGWTPEHLHIAECCVPPGTSRNHAVLLIQDADGSLYVASNGEGFDGLIPINKLNWTQWGWFDHATGLIDDFTFPGEAA